MSANPPPDPFDLVGTVLDGKFRIESAVAEGGFGLVYRATHLTLDRPVALKVLKHAQTPGLDGPDFIEGFVREARTIARLSHPHIVQVLDFGVSAMPHGERSVWMALEWIVGEALDEALMHPSRAQGMAPLEVMRWMRGALEALAYAHDEGVAHRDVKPSNFMLVKGKRGESLRLLDFGIAKVMGDQVAVGSGETETQSEKVSCSPRYAAPEQFGRGRTGPWTDVHALGLVLTHMLTGEDPYRPDNIATLCFDALRPERPTPGAFGVDVGLWEPVLLRALTIRPPDRYPNAGALLAALEEALPGATHVRRGPSRAREGAHDEVHALPSVTAVDALARSGPSGSRGLAEAPREIERQSAPRARTLAVGVAVSALGLVLAGAWRLTPRDAQTLSRAPQASGAGVVTRVEVAPQGRVAASDPPVVTDAGRAAEAPVVAEPLEPPERTERTERTERPSRAGSRGARQSDASAAVVIAPDVSVPRPPLVAAPAGVAIASEDAGRQRYRVE